MKKNHAGPGGIIPVLKVCAFVILFSAVFPVFGQEAAADSGSESESGSIVNNDYYERSVGLTRMARDAYEEGDYDASAAYAEEAARYARLSDEYVARRLAADALRKARRRMAWARSVGAQTRYADEYAGAETSVNGGQDAYAAEQWGSARDFALRALEYLAGVQEAAGPPPPAAAGEAVLPAQYTVRQWKETGDSFSAIAGWPWVYGDVYQWRRLYEANRDKLPNPGNPHLITPGMVLDIPSLSGEVRRGMYDPGVNSKN